MGEVTNIVTEKLDPTSGLYVSMALFRNVKNSKVIKDKVVSGALQCSIIKPSLIAHPFQVVVAANKAAASQVFGSMVTKSIYTELLFNLSISKNISQSLMKFGINESDQDILVATIHAEDASNMSEIMVQVEGQVVPLTDLQNICDFNLLRKSYKISEDELKVTSLLDSIVSRIATSDFVSH
ncbi:EKC/KEOPS complex subunit Tprkb-like [Thrips palmi]|uniref:EKC/KEOPS complex subunit Tprkb-like n=1 Tax=Thrips palmi TaxID=161013 RepID=A0A6P8YU74_THRPL|nr:EKC/KEOPS complex subunit Tprkb-like [Thrips palmi]